MALSFSLNPDLPPRKTHDGKITVLVTGATGNIGSHFAANAKEDLQLRLMVTQVDDRSHALEQFGEVVIGDITNPDSLKSACAGIDTVIHLAGEAGPEAPWSKLLPLNIEGTYNMMVAARSARCRRVVYSSSIHAISGYPPDVQVKSTDPVNPGDLYGVTKCFAEAMGRYMAEQEGLSVICLRIGAFQPEDWAETSDSAAAMDAWVSQRDMAHMLDLCVRDAHLRFAIFNALSDNRFKRMDISDAREMLGYRPQDDLTRVNPSLKDLKLSEKVSSHSLGDKPDPQKSGIRDDLHT
jgi:nucleoside-diphosphate-sugar epimerase